MASTSPPPGLVERTSVNTANIPLELSERPQWVCWRWETRDDGKPTKPPYQPNGRLASVTDKATWVSFEKALAAYERDGFNGIGFVLTPEDPFAAVDLDYCINEDGLLTPEAASIVSRLASYTERTPSGKGLRLLVKAALPPGGRKRGHVEMYDSARYVTVTGDRYPGTPPTIEERSEALALIHREIFGSEAPQPVPAARSTPAGDDQKLIARALAARNASAFSTLWNGDTTGYPSQSEADLALCSHLAFWTGNDAARMDRLFRQSGLFRPKWDERHGEMTYGQMTIEKALTGGTMSRLPGNALSLDQPSEASPWPSPLAPQALYGLAGDVVRAIAPHTEADPAALLVGLLVAVGNAIGPGPHARAEADRHGGNLFAVLVGETSKARKGSSWGHIRELLARVDPDWASRIAGGLSSGEGVIWEVRDPIQKTVPVKDPKGKPTGDYTSEVVDTGVSDKRLLVYEPEFSAVLKVMSREGNTLSPTIRQAWDSGSLRILTKNSPAKATGAHVSIIAHVTKAELLRYLTDTEAGNGFANRFLWVCTKRAKVLPEGGGTPDYGPLVQRLHDALQRAKGMGELHRGDAARSAWAEVYPELSEGKPGLFGAVTARGEAIVLRLCTLYAALDGATDIALSHLEAALAVWEYCEASARYIFGDATGDPIADRIREGLRQNPGGLTRTQISALFARHVSEARLDQALGLLTRAGLAHCERQETGGRPSDVWHAG